MSRAPRQCCRSRNRRRRTETHPLGAGPGRSGRGLYCCTRAIETARSPRFRLPRRVLLHRSIQSNNDLELVVMGRGSPSGGMLPDRKFSSHAEQERSEVLSRRSREYFRGRLRPGCRANRGSSGSIARTRVRRPGQKRLRGQGVLRVRSGVRAGCGGDCGRTESAVSPAARRFWVAGDATKDWAKPDDKEGPVELGAHGDLQQPKKLFR